MTPYYDDGRAVLHVGHVLDVLAGLEAGSVQTCITSPPYWGLRAYGTDPQVWGGGDCAHQFTETNGAPVITGELTPKQVTNAGSFTGNSPSAKSTLRGNGHIGGGPKLHSEGAVGQYQPAATCTRCGAWRGELGSEPTPEQYVANIVAVFRAVRRVLRYDGCIWVNLGDSYNAGTSAVRKASHNNDVGYWNAGGTMGDGRVNAPALKPKDLVGIPWRVAFALQADGWYLRSDIIWHKPNPMPESVTDRPTRAHEYIFLLSKNARYFYDADAIKEPMKDVSLQRLSQPNVFTQPGGPKDPQTGNRSHRKAINNQAERLVKHEKWKTRFEGWDEYDKTLGRNARSVWEIATEPYPAAHFATFPRKLVEPCVLAGSRPEDVVLDPFAGSGTTLAVARWHQRRAVGIELNPEYARLIEQRLAQGVLL